MVKRYVMVASRWCWVVNGGSGNMIGGFHGGTVLLGYGIIGLSGGSVLVVNFIASG